jgi:hypothetical protein
LRIAGREARKQLSHVRWRGGHSDLPNESSEDCTYFEIL